MFEYGYDLTCPAAPDPLKADGGLNAYPHVVMALARWGTAGPTRCLERVSRCGLQNT